MKDICFNYFSQMHTISTFFTIFALMLCFLNGFSLRHIRKLIQSMPGFIRTNVRTFVWKRTTTQSVCTQRRVTVHSVVCLVQAISTILHFNYIVKKSERSTEQRSKTRNLHDAFIWTAQRNNGKVLKSHRAQTATTTQTQHSGQRQCAGKLVEFERGGTCEWRIAESWQTLKW